MFNEYNKTSEIHTTVDFAAYYLDEKPFKTIR